MALTKEDLIRQRDKALSERRVTDAAYFDQELEKLKTALTVCYVCGKVRRTHVGIGKGLYKDNNKECQLRIIQEIDRLYIDASLIPSEGITQEWKQTITKKKIPFIGVDVNQKGKIVVKDPFVSISATLKPVKQYKNIDKPLHQYGSISEMIEMLKQDRYTIEELVAETNLALSTVKAQVTSQLKKVYELEITEEEGKKYYRIVG